MKSKKWMDDMDFPNKKYSVIYADPPWSYRQKGAKGKKQGYATQHYNTMTTDAEICLLGVTPDFRAGTQIKSRCVQQIIEAPIQAHSVKPDETRRRIVELMGDVPRVELFARQRAPGWDAWGDEIKEMEELR